MNLIDKKKYKQTDENMRVLMLTYFPNTCIF